MIRSSRTAVRTLLFTLVASAVYLDYWEYSREFKTSPDMYLDIVQGTAAAPQQYRVLVVRTAWFLHQHVHLGMRHAFALIDLLTGLLACFVLLHLLERSKPFLRATAVAQTFAYTAFLFLCGYHLLWLTWFQRPETLPTAALIALMLLLFRQMPRSAAGYTVFAVAAMVLSITQALVRADVSFCIFLGLAVAALLAKGQTLPQPRAFLVPLALICAGAAGGVQWFMMHHVYPDATYRGIAVIQLFRNLEPYSIPPFALFILPTLWTMVVAIRRWRSVDPQLLTMLFAACLFLPLWTTVGRIQEVRIFLPFALALMPLTVACALDAFGMTAPGEPSA